MSFHPNDVVRRGREATVIVCGVLVFLLSAFFRAQVLRNEQSLLQSEENRLRQIPTAAPRGVILDRNNKPIAENVVGYSVALLAQNEDTLRATLTRLRGTISLTNKAVRGCDQAVPARSHAPNGDRSGRVVRRRVGARGAPDRVSELDHSVGAEAHLPERRSRRRVRRLHERDQRRRVGEPGERRIQGRAARRKGRPREAVRAAAARTRRNSVRRGRRAEIASCRTAERARTSTPQQGPPLYTNIDIDLQEYIHTLFADTLAGAVVAMVPKTGEVLAHLQLSVHRSQSVRRRRVDGLLRLAAQRSATAAVQQGDAGTVSAGLDVQAGDVGHWPRRQRDHVRHAHAAVVHGFYYFGNRAWHCWKKEGHGSLESRGRDRAVVRRVLLPARPEDRSDRDSLPAASRSASTSERASTSPKRSVRSFRRAFRTTSIRSTARAGGPRARTS